jgi:hypothetical protein
MRFHHMSPAFLMTSVLRSERWADCPLLAHACSSAVMYQSMSTSVSQVPHETDKESIPHPFKSAKPSRVRDKDTTYSFEAQLPLADCLPLGANETMHLRLGVVEGYVVSLSVTREVRRDAAPTLALNVELNFPDTRDMEEDEEDGEEETDSVGLSGPMAAVGVAVAGWRDSFTHVFGINSCYGYNDVFMKPWDEAVCEGSDHFPEGRMPVKVDVHLVADKHMKPHVPLMGPLSE